MNITGQNLLHKFCDRFLQENRSSVFTRVAARPISNGSFWSRDNDEYNRTASNVFNNLHNLCSDAEFCVYLAYILFYRGLILRAVPVVFSGKCLLLESTVTIISHTRNALGRMGTSIRHSDFWNRWSIVFKASIDQSQVTLVHINDSRNHCDEGLYPIPL